MEAIKRHRQNRRPKTRGSIRFDNLNYDYLIRRSEEEGISIAALVNQIVRKERQNVPHSTLAAS